MQNKNRGAAMLEFALVAPFFFMLISCIIYGAMVMHDINSLNEITRNAARYGSVIESGVEVNDKEKAVKDFIKNKAANGGLFLYEIKTDPEVSADENSEISLGVDANASKEKAIKVKASAVMKDGLPTFLFLDYFPESMRTISSTVTMRRED
ncbi:TadE/TadG family type IV pilus assembly protein [uncultured Phascolarctobacterium sp.]|jgi:Flp pilus assembly protein TadG|uniref:TadE/TadG family type IV pilus assembly protein n=1 Tax=uncultured Phascolarctobacterium sp. TaxID=512296 RepID=UPI0025E5350F|nr:TadE family protein [uncultured Phascolarctobacterium sp.]